MDTQGLPWQTAHCFFKSVHRRMGTKDVEQCLTMPLAAGRALVDMFSGQKVVTLTFDSAGLCQHDSLFLVQGKNK